MLSSPSLSRLVVLSSLLLGSLLFQTPASAHMTEAGRILVRIQPQSQIVELKASIYLTDLVSFLKFDKNEDKQTSDAELKQALPAILAYLPSKLSASNNQKPCRVLARKSDARTPDGKPRRRLFYEVKLKCPGKFGQLRVHNTILFKDKGGYRHYARIQVGTQIMASMFTPYFPVLTLNLGPKGTSTTSRPSPATQHSITKIQRPALLAKTVLSPPPSRKKATVPIAPLKAKSKVTLLNSTWDLARHFIWDGVIHILLGFDHVLFVLTLIVVARRFRQLLLILTAFTIGHSVTLILSTLNIVSLPPAPVEALIALTIVYTALENIIKADEGPSHRAWLTFLFGLIHGVGFSYVLRESLNLAGSARVSALLFFNVGVELGQLAIVFVLYPYILLSLSKTWYRNVMKGSSAVIFLVALFWLVERTLVLLGI